MEDLSELLKKSEVARQEHNWEELETISISLLRLLKKSNVLRDNDLKTVVVNYLSSIVGTGSFLTQLTSSESAEYNDGLRKLEIFLSTKPHKFALVASSIDAAREIALLARNPTIPNRTKIASHLRKIARPDLSVTICEKILEINRLQYYALTVLCGAMCDQYHFDKAIEYAEKALKYNPVRGKSYPLNSLTRAHTLKFKQTGEMSEIEKALEYGHESIKLKLDPYSANTLIAAAMASGKKEEIFFAQQMRELVAPSGNQVDEGALEQAFEYMNHQTPSLKNVDDVWDTTYYGSFDSLFDLVERDEGFKPEVDNVRGLKARFSETGWFLQGLCNVPCPNCEIISLHSYRKHFERYAKTFHYWGLVCDNCRTARDSVYFDEIEFSFISSDLEENFPVDSLCRECNPIPNLAFD